MLRVGLSFFFVTLINYSQKSLSAMKKTSTISVMFSLLYFGFSTVAIASPPATAIQLSQRGDRCDNALASVERKIQENRDIAVRFQVEDIPDDYWQEGRPRDGQKIVKVIMGGIVRGVGMKGNYQQMLNVMNSPQFQNALAAEIINGCNGAIGVGIGIDNTDWMNFYGKVSDRVQPFQCTSPPPGMRGPVPGSPANAWGFIYCY